MSCTGCDYSFANCSPLKIEYPGGKPEELFERFETEKSKWLNANRDAMHIVNNQTF